MSSLKFDQLMTVISILDDFEATATFSNLSYITAVTLTDANTFSVTDWPCTSIIPKLFKISVWTIPILSHSPESISTPWFGHLCFWCKCNRLHCTQQSFSDFLQLIGLLFQRKISSPGTETSKILSSISFIQTICR